MTDLHVFGFIQNGNHVSICKGCIEAIFAALRCNFDLFIFFKKREFQRTLGVFVCIGFEMNWNSVSLLGCISHFSVQVIYKFSSYSK